MKQLTGNITHYLFRNEENGYSIAKLALDNANEVIITGYFPSLSKEVTYQFEVEELTHPKYGIQYKVLSFDKANIQNEAGLISYLSSDLFTGIGPVKAKRIVEKLGDNAIELILKDKLTLLGLGLNRLQIERFHKQLFDNQLIEHTLIQLYGIGLTSKMAMKLFNKYGSDTLQVLKENPYRLMDDIDGVGFKRADELAMLFKFEKDDARRIRAALLYGIKTHSFQKGDTYIEKKALYQVAADVLEIAVKESLLDSEIDILKSSDELVQVDNNLYLTYIYEAETQVGINLKSRINTDINIDENEVSSRIFLAEKKLGITYTDNQKAAIQSALSNQISIITGGPGTGKTTIIHGLIEVYAKMHEIDLDLDSATEKILLVAPTGRASRRMQQVMGIQAYTIHRALGYNYEGTFYYNETIQLPQQLIIIDEASMIDVFLADNLFKAIPKNTKIVIVGDEDQLPSVGPGQVLSDIINSGVLPVIRLSEIHRQAKNSNIIQLASKVNNQSVSHMDFESASDIKFMNMKNEQILNVITKTMDEAIQLGYSLKDDIQVLIPIYKSSVGIDAINAALQKHFIDPSSKKVTYGDKTYYVGDKVIQLQNNPEKGIMNGDIGLIKDISKDQDDKDILYIDFDDQIVLFRKEELEDINLAYAISIHKSQGSEYKVVIMPLSKSYFRMLRKELLYTGITRTKTHLSLVGDLSLIVEASQVLNEKRQTMLKAFLMGEKKEETIKTVSPYDFM